VRRKVVFKAELHTVEQSLGYGIRHGKGPGKWLFLHSRLIVLTARVVPSSHNLHFSQVLWEFLGETENNLRYSKCYTSHTAE
jgi:hypothetical protein